MFVLDMLSRQRTGRPGIMLILATQLCLLTACLAPNSESSLERSWIILTGLVSGKSPDNFSGLSFWYKADALSASQDDPIMTWSDSSGNANDALQATLGNRPLYKSNVLNGMPVLEFDGSDDAMQGVDVSFSQITILAVAKFTKPYPGTGWRGPILSKRQVNPNNNVELYFQWGSSTGASSAVMRNSVDGTSQFFGGVNTTIDTWYLISATYDGNRNLVFSAGVQQGQSAINAGSIYDNASSFFLGRDNTGSVDRLQGQIAEVIMFNRSLAESERVQVECYLGTKYALYTVHGCY